MPIPEPLLVLVAATLGAVAGWGPIAGVADRAIRRDTGERMPLARLRLWSAGATAVGAALITWRLGLDPMLPALLFLLAAAVALSIVDLTEHRLPNAILGPTSLVLAALLLLAAGLAQEWQRLPWALAGAAGMAAFYLAIALVSPRAMGMGDVKLAVPLGAVLGWYGWGMWAAGLIGGFAVGGLVAIGGLLTRRVRLKGSIPFGPSMLVGAFLAILLLAPRGL